MAKKIEELIEDVDSQIVNIRTKSLDVSFNELYDMYENEELIAITKELADTLRKNRTIDWQKRDSARARMRMMIKKLLKKHKYPPEGMDDAVQTVMTQCELWTDNNDLEKDESNVVSYSNYSVSYENMTDENILAAESQTRYGKNNS